MNNKYSTKTLKECSVNDQDKLIREFFKICFPGVNYAVLDGKNILVLNVECLVGYLAPKNKVNVVTTSTSTLFDLILKHKNVDISNLNIDVNMRKKDILTKVKYYLKKINLNSMDYIFSNLPYKRDLYLSISEMLIPYLKEDGKLWTIGPLNTIASPTQMKFKTTYDSLWSHLERYKELPVEMYYGKDKIFDQYGDYTFLGAMCFIKTKTSFNIYNEWTKFQEPAAVNLIDKIKNSNYPTLADVLVKNSNHGILVPLTNVTGGYDRTNRAVYMDFIYYEAGKCYVKGEVIPISKYQNSNKISLSVRMNSVDQAKRFHTAYRDNTLLQGFASLSCGGTRHLDYSLIPYFSMKEDISFEDIVRRLNLTEEDITLLRKYSKPFKKKQPKLCYRIF